MKRRLVALLERCRMGDGGYCTFRDPESGGGFSNIADTCHALEIWRALGIEPPGLFETVRWIRTQEERSSFLHRSPALHWLLSALDQAGLPWQARERELFFGEVRRLLDLALPAEETDDLLLDLASLLRLPGSPPLDPAELSHLGELAGRSREGGAQSPRPLTLPGLEARVDCMKKSGLFSREELLRERKKEESFRHPVLGWVLVPGSTASDLFVLRSGWRLSGGAPHDPWLARVVSETVRACRGREGGFAPICGAAPNLHASACALALSASAFPGRREPAEPDDKALGETETLPSGPAPGAKVDTSSPGIGRGPFFGPEATENDRS
ncbi:MAG: hypothetical protein ACP5OS_06750 [Leptospirillia bacterium]